RIGTDPIDRTTQFVLPVLTGAGEQPAFREVAARILATWAVAISETESSVILSSVPDEVLVAVRDEADPAAFLDVLGWLADDADLRAAVASEVTALRAR
ncbi:MAG: hypothetical protein ACTHZX_12350, partial [Microbacterium sp.]